MKLRRKRGATMGLVAACVLALVIIGFAVYFLARMLSGNKQVANATDAGAINAAKEILAVTADITTINWPTGGVGNPPTEFTGLGVSYNDTTETNNGLPNPNLTQYNVMAYNRVAGVVLLEALNAVYAANNGGDNGGIDNVNHNIENLQALGSALYTNIQASAQPGSFPPAQTAKVAYAFQDVTGMENVNSSGATEPQLESNLNLGFIGTGSGATAQAGKANVYFAANTLPTTYSSMLTGIVDTTGGTSATPPTGFPDYAGSGQGLVYGYTPLQITQGDPGGYGAQLTKFYAVNANPNQFPHLIDLGRFNAETGALPGVTNNCVPPNAISGATKTAVNTFKGAGVANNLFTTAIASAVMGSGSFSYPITFTHGYVRVRNDFDTAYNNVGANPSSGPIPDYGAQANNVDYANNSIFNNELYNGQNGTYNGLNYWTTTSSVNPNLSLPAVVGSNSPYNLIFCTEVAPSPSFSDGPSNGVAPYVNVPSNWGGENGWEQVQLQWVPYLSSGANPTFGKDALGHDPTLDPTGGVLGNLGPIGTIHNGVPNTLLPVTSGTYNGSPTFNGNPVYYYQASVGNPYVSNPWLPNWQLRTLTPYQQFPPQAGGTTSQAVPATALAMSGLQISTWGTCTQNNYDENFPGNLTPACDNNLEAFAASYGRGYTPPSQAGSNIQNTSQGGLTNVEYIKGQVVNAYINMGIYNGGYHATVTGPVNPSGMRYWDEAALAAGTASYAQPTNDQIGSNPAPTIPNNPQSINGQPQVNPSPVEPGGFAFGQNATAAAYMNQITQNFGSGTAVCGGNLDLTNNTLWNNPTTIQGMLLQRCRQIYPNVQITDLYDKDNPGNGLLSNGQLDLGNALYIYYDPTAAKLVSKLSTDPSLPSWITQGQQSPTTNIPAGTLANWGVQSGYHTMTPIPDGHTINCSETQFTLLSSGLPSNSGVIDAAIGFGGAIKGDLDLHDQPFMSVNGSANMQDAVVFRTSSGANGLLGDLVFQNKAGLVGANGSGSATFSAPN